MNEDRATEILPFVLLSSISWFNYTLFTQDWLVIFMPVAFNVLITKLWRELKLTSADGFPGIFVRNALVKSREISTKCIYSHP